MPDLPYHALLLEPCSTYQVLLLHLHLSVLLRNCSGSFDYATPVDQQFQFDYDLSMQQDQRSRSPAASPVRHVTKRPRHAAGALRASILAGLSAAAATVLSLAGF
jgi:hypothetical protein